MPTLSGLNTRYGHSGLQILYLLLHTILGGGLLYLFMQSLGREAQASGSAALLLFFAAKLAFTVLLLSPRLSLRIVWALGAVMMIYLAIQGLSDYMAGSSRDTGRAIAILYRILQARMVLVLASLLLLSSALALRFGKYRSIEAVVLLLLSLFLLTREQLSLSFEGRYGLYRLFWLGLPAFNLLLLGLTLHPFLRHESGWLSPLLHREQQQTTDQRPHRTLRQNMLRRGKQLGSCLTLLLLLFLLLWWTKISPIHWNRRTHGSGLGNGLLQENLNNQFDFGEYLQLDSSLEQDRQLVMMTKIENLRSDRPSYLIRFTLSGLSAKAGKNSGARSFFRDPKEPNMPGESPLPPELGRGISLFQMPQYDLRQSTEADMFLLNIKPSSLFVLNYPTEVQTFENWPDSSFSRVYRVRARTLEDLFPFGRPLQDYGRELPAELLDYYSYLPERYHDIGVFAARLLLQDQGIANPNDLNGNAGDAMEQKEAEALLEMGRQVAARISPLELARIFTNYFQREYRYSLKPGIAEDGDQLRYFLFEARKGYCTYFAFSQGLMLRAMGVPSRIAVGFLLNPALRILDYYPLFADQAHAWVEVFDPEQGWVTFDPTTFELAPGEELQFGLPEGAEADLAALTEELLRNNTLSAEQGLQQLRPEQSPAQQLLARLLEGLRGRSRLLLVLVPVLLFVLLLLFRARLSYLALRAEWRAPGRSEIRARIVGAMHCYLHLLNYHLFSCAKSRMPASDVKLPQQLHSWQRALEDIRAQIQVQSPMPAQPKSNVPSIIGRYRMAARRRTEREMQVLLHNSLAALVLLQKYYFSPQFGPEDAVSLRRCLLLQNPPQDVPGCLAARISCQPWYLVLSCYDYYFSNKRKDKRLWLPTRNASPAAAGRDVL